MLLANNLSFHREGREIFKEVNISLAPKKIIHLQGRNGIGKTTLIRILVNMILPSTGAIYWKGKSIKKNLKEYLTNITYIMDTHTSKSEMTVSENIQYWIKLFTSPIKSKELDAIFNILALDNYKKTKVNYLSTGEIKKLELCRLVIEQKKLWILDEPYAGLDELTTDLINETFRNHILNDGMIIFSSHYYPQLQNMETVNLENYANN